MEEENTDSNSSITKPIENLSKKPAKSILKTTSSTTEQPALNRQNSQDKDIKWDETNILQTLHPPDKDYGHMKIEEPKTPYSYFVEDDDGQCHSDNEMATEIDPENLSKLIDKSTASSSKSKFTFDLMDQDDEYYAVDDELEDIENETEEDRLRRKEFEQKRKKHYNEYQMVKLARKLLQEEMIEDNDDEDDGDAGCTSANISVNDDQ